jgi:GDP/UDP-N,N'-diacetylbacillosamine 2-epimerase (hydrolysing)
VEDATRLRKILYITGTRADFGVMRPVLDAIARHPRLDLELIVTGMHIMPEFGMTIDEIKDSAFKYQVINATYKTDEKTAMVDFIAVFIRKLLKAISKLSPDVILLLGDRAEMLGGAIVGTYLTIPVAHIHGGDVSSTIDEHARHAITKLSHIHFPATETSRKRLIKMGEERWRVKKVGSPAIDAIAKIKFTHAAELQKKYDIDLSLPFLLLIQHPVTTEIKDSASQIRETLEAAAKLRYQTVIVYPNADAGGRRMIEEIKKYRSYPFMKTFESIAHSDYLSLMRLASAVVGNSSSGIVEACSFGLPVVNIGTRQDGREQAGNVINVPYKKENIAQSLQTALFDTRFRDRAKKCKNPYGDGKASERIAKVLDRLVIDERLLQKKFVS